MKRYVRIRMRDSLENRVDRECRRIAPTDVLGRFILYELWRFRRVSHNVDWGFEFYEASDVFDSVARFARLIYYPFCFKGIARADPWRLKCEESTSCEETKH